MRLLRSEGTQAKRLRLPATLRQCKLLKFVLGLVVFLGIIAVPVVARAQTAEGTADAVGGVFNSIAPALTYAIINWLIPLMGRLLTLLVSVLVWVSGYSDFVNSIAVVNGWVIVRDIANMFFIIVLLIVAFGTILGQEAYHYKKLLPKLLMMAVLVNFSRTIVGVMIDAAQVVMLTFVNGYSAAAGGNFAAALQIKELLTFNRETCGKFGSDALGESQILIGATLALGMLVVSIITITVILAVLLLRIVVLWFLTVMSPMAFLLGTFPQGQKYYTQWWEEFQNQVIVGPVLAFFLWLSLVTVGSGNAYLQITNSVEGVEQHIEDKAFPAAACTDAGQTSGITSFAIATLMLLAGTQMAQQMGGAIAGVAGQAKNIAKKGLKFGLGMGLVAPAGFLEQKLHKITGVGLNPMRYVEAFKAYSQRRKILDAAEGAFKAGTSATEIMAGKGRLAGIAGIVRLALGSPQDFFENYMGLRGVKRMGGILAGGSAEAARLRHQIEPLSKIRALFRTEEEQEKAKNKVEELDTKAAEQQAQASMMDEIATTGIIDLTDQIGQKRAVAHLAKLKEEIEGARKVGDVGMARRLEEDREKLTQAMENGNSAFNFGSFSSKGMWEDSLKGVAENIRGEIKKIEEEKVKLQDGIDKAAADPRKFIFADADKKRDAWKKITDEMNELERKAAFRTPPTPFYAAENFKHLEAEERKKMPKHGLEATEVIEQMQSALVERDKVKFMTWFKKAAEDYNDNEVWPAFGFNGNFKGIEEFREKIMMGELGMTEQESMSHMSDINYINEEKGHYDASRMYKVHNGVYQTRTEEEWAAAVINENLKKDSRKFLQNTNRLGFGGHMVDQKYEISIAGLGTIAALQSEVVNRIERGEMNQSAIQSFLSTVEQLTELQKRQLLTVRDKEGRTLIQVMQKAVKDSPLGSEGLAPGALDKLVRAVS